MQCCTRAKNYVPAAQDNFGADGPMAQKLSKKLSKLFWALGVLAHGRGMVFKKRSEFIVYDAFTFSLWKFGNFFSKKIPQPPGYTIGQSPDPGPQF